MTRRHPSAVVTVDHLYDAEHDDDDEIGAAWTLGPTAECAEPIEARAYDDDDEHYYTLSVTLPADPDAEDAASYELARVLARHAGVTRVTYPTRPDLDIS
jgi:hypothetical protein